jgi:hypothetical protein
LALLFEASAKVPQQTILKVADPSASEFTYEKWSVDGKEFIKQNGIACECQNTRLLWYTGLIGKSD